MGVNSVNTAAAWVAASVVDYGTIDEERLFRSKMLRVVFVEVHQTESSCFTLCRPQVVPPVAPPDGRAGVMAM